MWPGRARIGSYEHKRKDRPGIRWVDEIRNYEGTTWGRAAGWLKDVSMLLYFKVNFIDRYYILITQLSSKVRHISTAAVNNK